MRRRKHSCSRYVCIACGVVTAWAVNALAEDAAGVLDRLQAAHSRPTGFSVRCRTVSPGFSDKALAELRQKSGWWRVSETWQEGVTGRDLPVTGVERSIIGSELVVRKESSRLIGPPDQANARWVEIFAPSFWVQPFQSGTYEANYIEYAVLDPQEAAKARRAGRMPNIDLWGASCYPAMARYVIDQLRAAPDIVLTRSNDQHVLTSREFDTIAWVSESGELAGASLPPIASKRRRYEFSGSAAEGFLPARFPGVMEVFETTDGKDELVLVELYDPPAALTETDRRNLDPHRMGVTLVDQTPRRSAETPLTPVDAKQASSAARPTAWMSGWRRNFAGGVAALFGLAAVWVWRIAARRAG